MLPDYTDIKALAASVGHEPDWYDAHGVPRYATFEPRMLGVYDHFAVLAKIGCQGCDETFLVGEGKGHMDVAWWEDDPRLPVLEDLAVNYHYGDPPRHGGCMGETMGSFAVEMVEVWTMEDYASTINEEHRMPQWERVPKYEGVVSDAY